ncbi:MAG: pantoate--beta-alanine ligase [Candidatus Omnitrophica bacterium]|nr:pantoate--beta-alanine ligase [Candidatus Omnitrophota bacterium]
MKIITEISKMRQFSRDSHGKGASVGFVPTMGYLHEGHLSLVRAAGEECDTVVMSIFVNPTQFGPGEDLDRYPRDMERDTELAEKEGVDAVFVPSVEEMYPQDHNTNIEVSGHLTEGLCGAFRPGHFRGVTTVVGKLFNIVNPDKAYFGQKDAQQAAVIRRMVRDLNMPVEVRVMPIVREKDGLAMSSRNSYLSPGQRHQALALYKSLERAREMILAGEDSAGKVKDELKKILLDEARLRIDYAEIIDAESFRPVERIKGKALIAAAVYVGETRLIDNVMVGSKE